MISSVISQMDSKVNVARAKNQENSEKEKQ